VILLAGQVVRSNRCCQGAGVVSIRERRFAAFTIQLRLSLLFAIQRRGDSRRREAGGLNFSKFAELHSTFVRLGLAFLVHI
jgi:hypothetical protein